MSSRLLSGGAVNPAHSMEEERHESIFRLDRCHAADHRGGHYHSRADVLHYALPLRIKEEGMRSYLLRSVDSYMNFIDRGSRFWGIVIILFAILFFGPLCLNIYLR
jgi:hypothetical protein